jgi:hypothetical protein
MSYRRNTLLAVLKTLLYTVLKTLLQRQSLASKKFLENFHVKGEIMFSSIEAIWIELHRALQFTELTIVFFVVDALDECDEESLETFLGMLTDEESANLALEPNAQRCNIKWILLSRNESVIKDHLGTSATQEIDLEANSVAVRHSVDQFVRIKVEELAVFKRYSFDLKTYVSTTLKEKADGTFLWVH